VTARECGAIHPPFERLLRGPSRIDEIRVAGILVRGSQQLKGFEALGFRDFARPIGEAGLEIAATLVRDGDGVDDYV
jgi:hypothetical protein